MPHKRQNEAFPMKGIMRCNLCNALVTGATSTGKMGLRFPKKSVEREKHQHNYYRCFKGKGHFSIRADKAESALGTLLVKMEPELMCLQAVVNLFRLIWTERAQAAAIEADSRKRELTRVEGKKARLLDSLAKGIITKEAFKRGTDPLLSEIARLRQELASQSFDVLDIEDAVGYLQSMFWNLLTM